MEASRDIPEGVSHGEEGRAKGKMGVRIGWQSPGRKGKQRFWERVQPICSLALFHKLCGNLLF